MKKIVALVIIFMMCMGSLISYLVLTDKATSGALKIAEGQKQLAEGEQLLAAGKAKLAAGRRKLGNAQRTFKGIKSIPFVAIANYLPISSSIMAVANGKISEGQLLVARGSEKVKTGEQQLKEGKLELHQGQDRLNQLNQVRFGCGIAALIFGVIFVFLFVYWMIGLLRMKRNLR